MQCTHGADAGAAHQCGEPLLVEAPLCSSHDMRLHLRSRPDPRTSHLLVALLSSALVLPTVSGAEEYTCPTDPGFCYFDVGNDGCFDGGTDTGPIDDQLEAGPFPSPLPPGDDLPVAPGSIVCPPSVKRLDLPYGTATDWRTALGSDIKIFGAKIIYKATFVQGQSDDQITLRSGGDLVLVKPMSITSRNAAIPRPVGLHAEGDVMIEDGIQVKKSCPTPGQCQRVEIFSTTGDVTFGEKSKNSGSRFDVTSGNDIVLGDKSRITTYQISEGIRLEAVGQLSMSRPKIKTGDLRVATNGVTITGIGVFKTEDGTSIDAGTGDLVAEALKFDSRNSLFEFQGESILIGTPTGKTSKLKAKKGSLHFIATDEISIVNTKIIVERDVLLDQGGTTLSVLATRIQGSGQYSVTGFSTTTIQTGPGSVCNLTDTDFVSMILADDCGTVVGP